MFGKLLFLISVCMFIEIGFCGSSNEHVHIKLHVPEIIKRHTHVRTVYKHPHKPKPKPHKPKKGPHHHHDTKFKHSKYEAAESRPVWIPKQLHYKPKQSEETVPINEWQQKLAIQPLKKPKHSQKSPYALIEMMAEAGDDDAYKAKLYKQFQLQEKLKNQHMIPEYMVMDSSLSFVQDEDNSDDIYTDPPSVDHFKNPQLMKITEADIRPKANAHVPQWGYDSSSQEIAFYKKPHEWPMVGPSSVAYQYTTLAPLHLSSNSEDDDEEFMPSALIQHTKHSSLKEYPNLFQSNKPKPMDPPYTYTKYKNRQSMKNAMSNLNTRVN